MTRVLFVVTSAVVVFDALTTLAAAGVDLVNVALAATALAFCAICVTLWLRR